MMSSVTNVKNAAREFAIGTALDIADEKKRDY